MAPGAEHLRRLIATAAIIATIGLSVAAAHEVSATNARFVEGVSGTAPIPFLYLGAKHMVTGLDHVLFLMGIVFFLRAWRDIVLYVSLFTLGHSLTLMGGVMTGFSLNAYLVDAIIGLSVVYKGFENIGGLRRFPLDTRAMVLGFGLVHGLGLSGKLQQLALSPEGLLINMLSFNLGVEIGQVVVLALALALLNLWRQAPRFESQAGLANIGLMVAGFTFMGMHLVGLLEGGAA